MPKSSRVWLQRWAHHVEPKAPRFELALMPPRTSMGALYSK